ncbi:DNA alkylation repair protein [Bacteroides coprosuis]|uniref:DNA alkylation repair protein n=1 Tax=Bacteroides coprosuis TaxID=151276 RepID=UPI001DE7677A|nr:DNA alkylation repair protein [Bacteroides coprosuis]HJD92040.1 DNA alkylation repair protein [Bacteroides coprosuis]
MNIHEQIKEIKGQLRLFMNGVVSASMRKKGLDYKLNFGVELPRIKEIAKGIGNPSVALAEALWMENIRECKILATLIYPKEDFSSDTAELWVSQVENIEIARLLSMHILQHLDYIRPLCLKWIASGKEMNEVIGYITISRLLLREDSMDERAADEFTNQAITAAVSGDFILRDSSILALKNFMQQNENHKNKILALVEPLAQSENEFAKVLYNLIQEEAMYL